MNIGCVGEAAWLSFWMGIAVSAVGQMSEPSAPYPWYLPVLIICILVPNFVFGFYAGKHRNNKEDDGI